MFIYLLKTLNCGFNVMSGADLVLYWSPTIIRFLKFFSESYTLLVAFQINPCKIL